jgi:hypothetical protein
MQTFTGYAPFQTGHGRAMAVIAALAAGIVVDGLSALLTGMEIFNGTAGQVNLEDDLTIFDFLQMGVGLLLFAVWLMTVVLFCVWIHRAYKNLPALGNPPTSLAYSPRWAVGGFFIPFANLVIPYRVTREILTKSNPWAPADSFVGSVESSPFILKFWWALWLIANFVSNAAWRTYSRAESEEALLIATNLDLLSSLLAIPAAVLAIFVIREIDRRQEERSKRVFYGASVPPPPPNFAVTI